MPINAEAFEPVLRWLDAGGELYKDGQSLVFDMLYWNCGTTMCIGGALEDFNPVLPHEARIEDHALFLRTEESKLQDLYFMGNTNLGLDRVTPARAAAVVRHFINTEEVDWELDVPGENLQKLMGSQR